MGVIPLAEKQTADAYEVAAFFHGDPVIGAHAHG